MRNKTWIPGPSFLMLPDINCPVNQVNLQELLPGDPEVKMSAAIEVSTALYDVDAVFDQTYFTLNISRMGEGLNSKVSVLSSKPLEEESVNCKPCLACVIHKS